MGSNHRASALDIASAIAGGVFFTIATFFILGAMVWAGLSALKVAGLAIGVGEALAAVVSIAIGVLMTLNGLKLVASGTHQ